jgi:hypothetical protein
MCVCECVYIYIYIYTYIYVEHVTILIILKITSKYVFSFEIFARGNICSEITFLNADVKKEFHIWIQNICFYINFYTFLDDELGYTLFSTYNLRTLNCLNLFYYKSFCNFLSLFLYPPPKSSLQFSLWCRISKYCYNGLSLMNKIVKPWHLFCSTASLRSIGFEVATAQCAFKCWIAVRVASARIFHYLTMIWRNP